MFELSSINWLIWRYSSFRTEIIWLFFRCTYDSNICGLFTRNKTQTNRQRCRMFANICRAYRIVPFSQLTAINKQIETVESGWGFSCTMYATRLKRWALSLIIFTQTNKQKKDKKTTKNERKNGRKALYGRENGDRDTEWRERYSEMTWMNLSALYSIHRSLCNTFFLLLLHLVRLLFAQRILCLWLNSEWFCIMPFLFFMHPAFENLVIFFAHLSIRSCILTRCCAQLKIIQ